MSKHLKKGAGGGPGRPKGVKETHKRVRSGSKKQLARHAAARILDEIKDERSKLDKHDKPELPLERLMRRMNDPDVEVEVRDQLATWAAPYVHPKLSSIAVRPGATPVGPDGKAVIGSEGTGAGKITVTMEFDNNDQKIKEDEV